jgi:sulfonate transport system ATP-binding protein
MPRHERTGRSAAAEATAAPARAAAMTEAARDPSAGPACAVDVRGVSRRFGKTLALDNVNLSIAPGEFVALLGRSGSGKSTLLRTLAGLDTPTAGTVRVPHERMVVFQEPRLLPWKTALQNVALGLRGEAIPQARAALAEVGLEHRLDAYPATLSGGEAQRTALARALVRDPKFLLLDEPFAALDALTRMRMHGLVESLWAQHHLAVLLITHDVEEAILLADRALVIDKGAIAASIAIDLPRPRDLAQPGFITLRRRLLQAIGVTEAENRHSKPADPQLAAEVGAPRIVLA